MVKEQPPDSCWAHDINRNLSKTLNTLDWHEATVKGAVPHFRFWKTVCKCSYFIIFTAAVSV